MMPPESLPEQVVGLSRWGRRALRLDRMNVVLAGAQRDSLVIIRGSKVFYYDIAARRLMPKLHPESCRNVLHGALEVFDGAEVVSGEYGRTGSVKPMPIYRGIDAGRSWDKVFQFDSGAVKHVPAATGIDLKNGVASSLNIAMTGRAYCARRVISKRSRKSVPATSNGAPAAFCSSLTELCGSWTPSGRTATSSRLIERPAGSRSASVSPVRYDAPNGGPTACSYALRRARLGQESMMFSLMSSLRGI